VCVCVCVCVCVRVCVGVCVCVGVRARNDVNDAHCARVLAALGEVLSTGGVS
jgi:hypothetical protein